MMDNAHSKQQVRQFYDRVGWQEVSEGMYQNASYEDLRPVSRKYIQRCHLRVNRFLPPKGNLLLDAGSGPIQYPEYLTYSEHYRKRVCVDISIVALQEARKRIQDHGWFVVADVAYLPFANETFDGIVSLHTLHHVSLEDQKKSYEQFDRLLSQSGNAVVVNGWGGSPLMQALSPIVQRMEKLFKHNSSTADITVQKEKESEDANVRSSTPQGTFVKKLNADVLRKMLEGKRYQIYCWRSVSVRFLRAMIHPILLGRLWLALLYWLENRFPHFFGFKGQYPLVVIYKSQATEKSK
jgi:ubiquinone/menaquinone biosynthesis C-methylase UbiE